MKTKILYPLIVGNVLSACVSNPETAPIGYQPFSQTTVQIELATELPDSILIRATGGTNIPPDVTQSEELVVSSPGTYWLQLEADRPSISRLHLNQAVHKVMTIPGDTSVVEIVPVTGDHQLHFRGRTGEINAYYSAKSNEMGYSNLFGWIQRNLGKEASYDQAVRTTDSIVEQERSFLDHYLRLGQLPDWFIQYEKDDILYTGELFKMLQMELHVPENTATNHLGYLDSIQINSQSAALTASYLRFLENYFMLDIEIPQLAELAGYPRVSQVFRQILLKSRRALSGEALRVYNRYNFCIAAQFTADQKVLDSMAKEFGVEDYMNLLDHYQIKYGFKNLQTGDTIPEFWLRTETDSTVSIRSFRHNIVYASIGVQHRAFIGNIPNLNRLISEYSGNSKMAFVNIWTDTDRGGWQDMIQQHELQGINLWADDSTANRLKSYFNIWGIPAYALMGPGNTLVENHTHKAPQVKTSIEKVLLAK